MYKEIATFLTKKPPNSRLKSRECGGNYSKVEVLTIAQVLNFEDEMERSTDVSKAQDLTKSETVSDMKRAVNRMKDAEFRQALKRHKFDLSKLWTKKPPKAFSFIRQQAEEIRVSDGR
jgi:hypothetical protein